jgi:hypothetical protein
VTSGTLPFIKTDALPGRLHDDSKYSELLQRMVCLSDSYRVGREPVVNDRFDFGGSLNPRQVARRSAANTPYKNRASRRPSLQ